MRAQDSELGGLGSLRASCGTGLITCKEPSSFQAFSSVGDATACFMRRRWKSRAPICTSGHVNIRGCATSTLTGYSVNPTCEVPVVQGSDPWIGVRTSRWLPEPGRGLWASPNGSQWGPFEVSKVCAVVERGREVEAWCVRKVTSN